MPIDNKNSEFRNRVLSHNLRLKLVRTSLALKQAYNKDSAIVVLGQVYPQPRA